MLMYVIYTMHGLISTWGLLEIVSFVRNRKDTGNYTDY